MRILLGTSFFDGGDPKRQQMAQLWAANVARMDVTPTKIVCIGEGGAFVPSVWGDSVRLTGNLGHIHQHLDNGPKSHHAFTGWSASMLALAMLAYVDECDFIYRESDCLAWGPWVARMNRDCGDAAMVFGPKMRGKPFMACAQSLFLVRHKWIPTFVRLYISLGAEDNRANIGENKFVRIADHLHTARLSFGCDRERPIPWDAEVFYAQQFSDAELEEGKRRGLI